MSPRALLLSPDDQAVSAITGVLEEMSVTCERPMDGASAAQKLHSQQYDLVLVDCDNLPAAKLIFDVCRRANAGTTIPIAIVDGRAGLPTAFRLGAELILTKPVAKDQARTTVRTAVNRLRKEEPSRPIKVEPAVAPPVVAVVEAAEQPKIPETRAHAAAAGVESAPAKTVEPQVAPTVDNPKAVTTPTETAALLAVSSPSIETPPPPVPAPQPLIQKAKVIRVAKAQPFATADSLTELENSETDRASTSAGYKTPKKQSKKTSGAFVAVFILVLLGGGGYAAWMTQPAFRAFVTPQLDKAMMLAEKLTQRSAAPNRPVPPAAKPATPQASATQPTPKPNQVASNISAPSATSDSQQVAPSSEVTKLEPASAATKMPETQPSADKTSSPSSESNTEKAESSSGRTDAATSEAGQPWEKGTTILSSKGAEKRLVRQVSPAVPRGVRGKKTEGSVVLKALVNEDGSVSAVRLVEGDPTLAAAATKAVKQWRYKPFVRDGNRAPFQTIVIVDFQQP